MFVPVVSRVKLLQSQAVALNIGLCLFFNPNKAEKQKIPPTRRPEEKMEGWGGNSMMDETSFPRHLLLSYGGIRLISGWRTEEINNQQ
ncbi:hypothetical protein AOLI_G00136380 [Acnodon oligacanthus]